MSGDFRERSAAAVKDKRLLAAIEKTAELLLQKRAAAVSTLPGFEEIRDRCSAIKMGVLSKLPEHLETFTQNAKKAGAVVHFAQDGKDVEKILSDLARTHHVKTAVKTKSMTTEEIDFDHLAHDAGIEVTETDLGEFIIQLAGEKPSHIMAPAIHRDRFQVAELFHQKIGAEPNLGVEELVASARSYLRRKFLNADMGITGANFAIASTGSIVIVTNEGNGRMSTSLPRIQLVIAGIEKIIPSMDDLEDFLSLLTRSASGQTISTYVSITTGPKKPEDTDGPEELHIVLLDNGRKRIAAGPYARMLTCLHCGACLNHCPVYRAVGGHAYGSPYPGPMGDILSSLIWGIKAYPELCDACTLCGRCKEACPMGIPLPDFHLALRKEKNGGKVLMDFGARFAANPSFYRFGLNRLRSYLGKGRKSAPGKFAGGWTHARELPKPREGQTFRQWWKTRQEG